MRRKDRTIVLRLDGSKNQDAGKALTDLTSEELGRVNGGDYPVFPVYTSDGGDPWGNDQGSSGQDQGQGQGQGQCWWW